ncbi:MAG: DUF429 domain-containing protein [Solirubrobacteraceae bacterium]|nr:DUF429 domain-containing protein [Solirubrobacteraceae bacterium]
MHSFGLDLSTDPRKAWWCELSWPEPGAGGLASIVELGQAHALGARDDASLARILSERIAQFGPAAGRVAGIDAPVGWPQAFVDAMQDWSSGEAPRITKRPELRLRPTDRFIQEATGLTPMSVSTDRIGSTALLCAEVLSSLAEGAGRGVLDRARGTDGIAEVYPAAALRLWSAADGLPLAAAGYKTESDARERLLGQLAEVVELGEGDHEQLVLFDDAVDALLCALIARAVATGRTFGVDEPVRAGDLVPPSTRVADPLAALEARADRAEALRVGAAELADREGWIHAPHRAALADALLGD